MRIAVCVSGQFRTGDLSWPKNFDLLQSTLSNKFSEFKLDVYVATWRENLPQTLNQTYFQNLRSIFSGREIAYSLPKSPSCSDKLIQQTFKFLANYSILEEADFLSSTLNLPPLPTGRLRRKILNSLRMFFLIKRADMLRQEEEEKQGFRYDAVLRCRPDTYFLSNPILEFIDSEADIFFLRDPLQELFPFGPLNDQVFIATSHAMSAISSAFNSIISRYNLCGYTVQKGVHEVLVNESALSWHVYTQISSKIKIRVGRQVPTVLRPPIVVRNVPKERRAALILGMPYATRHEISKTIKQIVNFFQVDHKSLPKI